MRRSNNLIGEDSEAQQIFQELLDQISAAIQENDAERYVSYVTFPHRLQTLEKSLVINSPRELEAHFKTLVKYLSESNVHKLVRFCTKASFSDDRTILGFHQTKLIDQHMVIVEDYSGLSTLKHVNGTWKVADSQYAEPLPSIPSLVPTATKTVDR